MTTFDEIFKEITLIANNPASKKVLKYRQAILKECQMVEQNGYISTRMIEDVHPIIKIAMIHYQFESIHPFYDGNGRTGRIINVFYLVLRIKLKMPILYLSKYIHRTKDDYYNHLNQIRLDLRNIKDYLFYIINGVYETSTLTIVFIEHFNNKNKEAQELLQKQSPRIFSHELVNYLFHDCYTKNEYLRENIKISRNKASKYLKEPFSYRFIG